MTDKVQKIKEEIERRISQFEAKYPKDLGGYWNDEESAAYDCAEEYKRFLLFIDSLPEEHTSEDLEEEILCRWEDDPHTPWPKCPYSDFKNIARHFAEWQKEKDKQLVGATQKISHQHGYDEGRAAVREEMMKDAMECTWGSQATSSFMSDFPNIECGDKVKIIIVKED